MNPPTSRRGGHATALLAVLLPAIFGMLALTVDAGLLMATYRNVQHVADSAATAAARDLALGKSVSTASVTATTYVRQHNGLSDALVTFHSPPGIGPHAGRSGYVEVLVTQPAPTMFIHVLGGSKSHTVRTRAVAGAEDATAGAAIVVLDPSPSPVTISALSLVSLTIPPVNIGGLEVLGLGQVKVDGAVLVNTEWGGRDENGNPVGPSGGPPYGVASMPVLPLTRLKSRDLRVVGGVDNPNVYTAFVSGGDEPLQANRLPVPDPFATLPVPTTSVDPVHVATTNYGGVSVTGLPLIGPTKHLFPGVYDWIQVVSGRAVFYPGVYIIQGKNPLTQLSLSIVAGQVTAEGVMFYITNNASYSASSGGADASDGETEPAPPGVTALVPSVVINAALFGSRFTPLDDPSSPFDGMLIYQRRRDRRPIVIAGEQLVSLAPGTFSGTIYGKWAQILFAGQGAYDVRLVGGTVRFVDVIDTAIQPAKLLPPAQDVYLVE